MPPSRRKFTKWGMVFQYASYGIAIVHGIVLVPLYLRFIDAETYGAWLATGSIMAWLTSIDPGLSNVIQQRVSEAFGRRDVGTISQLATGSAAINLGIFLVMGVAGLACAPFVTSWIKLPSTVDAQLISRCFLLAAIGSALTVFSYGVAAMSMGLLSLRGTSLVFLGASVARTVLTVVLLLGGFGLYSLALMTLFFGLSLTVGNVACVLWRFRQEGIHLTSSLGGVRVLFRLMSFTFFSRAASLLSSNLDMFIVSRNLGPDACTTLNLTRKAPELARNFIERTTVSFMPAVGHVMGEGSVEKARVVLQRLLRVIFWLLGLVVAGQAALNSGFVSLWVGHEFFAGLTVNLMICLSVPIIGIANSLANLCFAMGNIRGNSLANVVQSVISVPLMILGARQFGLVGVILPSIVSTVLISGWYYPASFSALLNISRKDKWALIRELLIASVAASAIGLAFSQIRVGSWAMLIGIAMALVICYVGSLVCLSRGFRQELANWLKRRQATKTGATNC